ncbi:exodeoxyribonuclease VII small subunit [Feifania hominis]|uniref:Exodeoxyribonuclease 7 small subunit n=1 Tax=Feifania hominis TaxID=2763660 RepID=A0A926HPR5_9FIRM|nr:exodeoxyribonuclease VII small subunit [Feifania hominis]MBC8535547.1 exodeoxyribonuclease VII small subunit [Feifania hominis]
MSKELTFEAAINRLEEILKKLEAGDSPLAESLALFEEGVTLTNFCNKALDEAEQKVVQLTKDETGEVVESEFPAMKA